MLAGVPSRFGGIAHGGCPMSLDPSGSNAPRGLLVWTAATALLTGVSALGLVHHLARVVERPGARQASLPRGIVDPVVTGSIGTVARSVVLDPCIGNERLLVRGP